MNIALLLQFAGSIVRTLLPAATAYLAGLGVNVDSDNPWLTLVVAVVVYLAMQAWSLWRKWAARNAEK